MKPRITFDAHKTRFVINDQLEIQFRYQPQAIDLGRVPKPGETPKTPDGFPDKIWQARWEVIREGYERD